MRRCIGWTWLVAVLTAVSVAAEEGPTVTFNTDTAGRVEILVEGEQVASYVYEDATISRPYFANVHAPHGIQVTRNHPPAERDVQDHPEFHPGLWLAFGDLDGSDYWRLKATVKHVDFAEAPRGGNREGTFLVTQRYLDQQIPDETVCEEACRYTFYVRPEGYLLVWDSTFSSPKEFTFGDQEEMGLGIRVATALREERTSRRFPEAVPGTGTIRDSQGRRSAEEVWGNTADWCDYSGTLENHHAGITIFCHPENFRPSWFHARDYGFCAANAFGRRAFGKGPESKVVVKPGETLHLRYGILLHAHSVGETPDLDAAYQDYLQLVAELEIQK